MENGENTKATRHDEVRETLKLTGFSHSNFPKCDRMSLASYGLVAVSDSLHEMKENKSCELALEKERERE